VRPQEPSVPPFRTTGPGGTTRPDAPGPLGSDGYGGRGPAHARPDGDDPYGDVAPPSTGHGAGNGMHAPYGVAGWSGSDRYEPTPTAGPRASDPDPLDPRGPSSYGSVGNGSYGNGSNGSNGSNGTGTYGSGTPGNGSYGNGSYGNGAPGAGAYGNGSPGNGTPGNGSWGQTPRAHGSAAPGPLGPGAPGPSGAPARPGPPAPPPPPSDGPGRGGPPWAAAPAPAPFGVPRPDSAAPGAEPGRPAGPPAPGPNGQGSRPPSSPPGGSPAAAPGDDADATAAASSPSPAPEGGGGLAGADGFASRPPRPSRDTATTTGSTRTTGAGSGPGRHRRAGTGPGREDDDAPDTGDESGAETGRAARRAAEDGDGKGKKKRKGSFWRELPLLIVVAVVLTFVIQTFLARIYVIPSASMERTLHGCNGCANDRVAVDKVTYRFSDPAPGDVVVFRGPPAWGDNGEVSGGSGERSDNVLVRGLQSGLSLVGLAPPDEKDFVKRVIATGGQEVACCDPQNRVTVDGVPLTEPYLYYQPNLGPTQADFPPVRVPAGQLWVMGDNRNNSADARVHGPISITDVIGKARVIVLPVGRWGGVPDTDPQAQPSALGAPAWTSTAPLAAGVVGAVPLVVLSRRWRRSLHGGTGGPVPTEGGPAPPPSPGTPDR